MVGGITVYDDFAHHPTAIETTLKGLRARLPDARIIAVVEPRSNTMKLGVHRDQLAPALVLADRAWFLNAPELGWDLAAALASMQERVQLCEQRGCPGQGIGRGSPTGRPRAGDEQRRLRRFARQTARRITLAGRIALLRASK